LTTVQMSQTLLAEYAFQALRREVERTPAAAASNEYELLTRLVLRRSTALAPSDGSVFKSPDTISPGSTSAK